VHQANLISRIHDGCAAERNLAGSAAATKKRVAAIDASESMLKNVILKKYFT
jgi:2-polyprenyl-3-methyl-5-hydroxy-6-metoxy-1,4-benzoquinol methylase